MEKLKARGINVAPSQVYQILAGKRQEEVEKARGESFWRAKEETIVDHAVVFVKSAGGMQNARRAAFEARVASKD